MFLRADGHEHTHRSMRLLLHHRLHLRRLPNRPTAEPQDQEAEQDRSVLFNGARDHHRRHRYR